ncbi:MAG TPA: Rne/Rng family ribonuclease [Vicinamibacteria bacterium]
MSKDLVVSVTPRETRAALLEDGIVCELFVEREAQRGLVGNIYKGTVSRVLPGMEAAFIDIGLERTAFLHASDAGAELEGDLGGSEEAAPGRTRPRIEEMLREGQEVLVQVQKEAFGTKGARVSAHLSLPGRYLVHLPTVENVGVSRRIADEDERQRLRELLKELRQAQGGGFVARTAAQGRGAEELERDARHLVGLWQRIRDEGARTKPPALIHREHGLVPRLIRDLLGQDIASIQLDDRREYDAALAMVQDLQPELATRVQLVSGDLVEQHGLNAELDRALRPRVSLKSGGSIVINQTEALVAIDVNTGRYTGEKDLEQTVLSTNLEAVREVVRQIRLRDLGGIIVIDFIDMEERRSRRKVMGALQAELRRDRTPSKLLSVNEFGLVILTRKRARHSLERLLCQPCSYCSGSGWIKNVGTVCAEIYHEVRKLAADLRGRKLLLRVHPEVARALRSDELRLLDELAELVGHDLAVQEEPALHQAQFEVVPR